MVNGPFQQPPPRHRPCTQTMLVQMEQAHVESDTTICTHRCSTRAVCSHPATHHTRTITALPYTHWAVRTLHAFEGPELLSQQGPSLATMGNVKCHSGLSITRL
jgi:hypothetical protein